jgi:hypothetical protein
VAVRDGSVAERRGPPRFSPSQDAIGDVLPYTGQSAPGSFCSSQGAINAVCDVDLAQPAPDGDNQRWNPCGVDAD